MHVVHIEPSVIALTWMDSVILMLCGVSGMWNASKFVLAEGDKRDPNHIWCKTFTGASVKPHVEGRTWECSCYSCAPLFCWREYSHILIVSRQKKKNQFTRSNYLSSSLTSVLWVSIQPVGSYLYVSVLLQNAEHADVKMSFRLLAARLCDLKWTLLEMSCLRENRVDSVVLINLKLKGMLQQIFFSFSMTAVSSVCTNTRQEIVNFSPHSV